MEKAEEDQKKIARVLGEPVFPDFPERVAKMRRNLILFSSIAIFHHYVGSNFILKALFSEADLKTEKAAVETALIILVLYTLVVFLIYSIEYFGEWRIRCTGTRLAFITGAKYGSDDADYPDDPRQSTLYHWWLKKSTAVGSIREKIKNVESELSVATAAVESIELDDEVAKNSTFQTMMRTFREAQSTFAELNSSIKDLEKAALSARTKESLRRFNRWFGLYSGFQLTRWLILEFLLPAGVGSFALYVLYCLAS